MSTGELASQPNLSRVVMVIGKGGVGKTTVAAGLAAAAARDGQKAVFLEFGDGDSGRRALKGLGKRVKHEIVQADDALTRAATPMFGSRILSRAVLGNFAIRRLLQAAPAIRELAMLEVVRQVAEAHPRARVVVDMPATGHGVAWLRVPRQARDVLVEGRFHDLCDRIVQDLLSPGRTSVVVVTLPEKLVLLETIALCNAIATEVHLPVEWLLVNRLPAPLPEDARTAAAALTSHPAPFGPAAAHAHRVLESRRASRLEALTTLRDTLRTADHVPFGLLPLAPVDPEADEVATWLDSAGAR